MNERTRPAASWSPAGSSSLTHNQRENEKPRSTGARRRGHRETVGCLLLVPDQFRSAAVASDRAILQILTRGGHLICIPPLLSCSCFSVPDRKLGEERECRAWLSSLLALPAKAMSSSSAWRSVVPNQSPAVSSRTGAAPRCYEDSSFLEGAARERVRITHAWMSTRGTHPTSASGSRSVHHP